MKVIVTEKGRAKQVATMDAPIWGGDYYAEEYKNHIASLPVYPCPEHWEVGKQYELPITDDKGKIERPRKIFDKETLCQLRGICSADDVQNYELVYMGMDQLHPEVLSGYTEQHIEALADESMLNHLKLGGKLPAVILYDDFGLADGQHRIACYLKLGITHFYALIKLPNTPKPDESKEQGEEVMIHKFQLESIVEALRVVANTYDCREQTTCLDRMVTQAEQFAKNALSGDKDKRVQYGKRITRAQSKEEWQEGQERVLCAAIWYREQPTAKILPLNIDKGVVVAGLRHAHCIHTFVSLTGKRSVTTESGEYTQGFLTDKDRFVDREEAMVLAKKSGQVPTNQSFEELFSEDLY